MDRFADTQPPATLRTPLRARQLFHEAQIEGLRCAPTKQRYAIFSSQRTGSNYLCQRLCAVRGQLGVPAEYLNGLAVRSLAPQLLPGAGKNLSVADYLKAVERVRTTEDGCFGIKIQPNQLLPLLRNKAERAPGFLRQYDRLVLMTRRDKLGQAVSGAIAMATDKWFNDGSDPSFSEQQVRALMPVIARNLARYVSEEQLILNAGRDSGRPTLHIVFEDVVADGNAVYSQVATFLLDGKTQGLEEDLDMVVLPERPPGREAARLREAFLAFIGGTPAGAAAP